MEPHYIRCIKPNAVNRPMVFENMNVLHQVRFLSCVEVALLECMWGWRVTLLVLCGHVRQLAKHEQQASSMQARESSIASRIDYPPSSHPSCTAASPPCPALQLRCGGVLEAVRISCAGYPTKMPFADFIDHFWMLGLDFPQQVRARACVCWREFLHALASHCACCACSCKPCSAARPCLMLDQQPINARCSTMVAQHHSPVHPHSTSAA